MKSSQTQRGLPIWPILSLLAAALPAHAFTLATTVTPSTAALTCSTGGGTGSGPGTAISILVKTASTASLGSSTITVALAPVTGLVITAPSSQVLNSTNQSTGITYTVNVAAGCVGATTGAKTLQFSAGGTSDIAVTANATITVASTSSLTATPTAVALTCTRVPSSTPVYTPGPSQVVAVRSTTLGGTPFTVTTSGLPSWLTVAGSGTASTTAVNVTFGVAAGCGALAAGSVNNYTVHLADSPAPDKTIVATLRVVPPSPLTVAPSTGALTYVKGSGSPGRVDVNFTSSTVPAPFFSIDTSTLPIWLNVDLTSGSTPKSIRFTTTSAADSMPPGTYSGSVKVQVSNSADLTLPVTMQLNNPPSKLTIAEGLTRNITWSIGTPLPTPFITAVSSDTPIAYAVTTGGPLAPVVGTSNLKDLAYNIGTPIPITFDPNVFASAAPGTILTGTVALTWGNPATTTTITINVTIAARSATLSAVSPASLPTAAPGTPLTLTLSGSNFVAVSDPGLRTTVGIVTGSGFVIDPSISVNVVNPSNIILSITVSSTSTNLPFSLTGTGGTVTLGVCNPSGTACTTPTGTATFTIGGAPIIQSVTSSSSYLQVTAPTAPTVAPYDLISVFGASFCSSRGTGCSSSDVLRGTPDPATLAYPVSLSPDAASATQRQLTAVFQTTATPPVVIATAPLLFATNTQINLVVPAALSAYSGNTVSLVVNFGYGTTTNMLSSAPFAVSIADTNPGIFTTTGDGQGLGAVLGVGSAPVAFGNEAGFRSTGSDSDVVSIFMTGLGIPNSDQDNSTAGTNGGYSGDCITVQSYLDTLNAAAGTSLLTVDGLIVQSSMLNSNRRVPCFKSSTTAKPTVTIGGVAATVTYAGWVPDSVAGQYQVDVRVPASSGGPFTTAAGTPTPTASLTVPVQLPVVVTTSVNGKTSQAGVLMWATRKPKVVVTGSLTGTVGISGTVATVAATEGTGAYHYAVTSGLLPTGLALNGTTGVISGTPAANAGGTYAVTVTATDSANFPTSDKVSFTLTIAGGLFVSYSGTPVNATFTETFGVADANPTTVIAASGGTFPYTYALTTVVSSVSAAAPAGLTIDNVTNIGAITVDPTLPGGTYHLVATATDTTSGTPVTGSTNFDLKVGLSLTKTTPVVGTQGTASTITTVSTTGFTTGVTYALDSASATITGLAIDSAGVVTITTSTPVTPPTTVTVTATSTGLPSGAAVAGTGTIQFTLTVN